MIVAGGVDGWGWEASSRNSTSNGPAETINSRLEHLRGSASWLA